MTEPAMETTHRSVDASGARLEGPVLLLARVACLTAMAVTLLLFVVSLPAFTAKIQNPCAGNGCHYMQLTPESAPELQQLGLSTRAYALVNIAFLVIFVLGYAAVGVVLFWRRSDQLIALLGAFTLVTFGGTFSGSIDVLRMSGAAWRLPIAFLSFLGSSSLFFFFYVFPDGRFVPRWTRWAALAWFLLNARAYFAPSIWPLDPRSRLFATVVLVFFGSVVSGQVYRYRRVSGSVERQQTKWVVFGFATAIGLLLLDVLFLRPQLTHSSSGTILSRLIFTGVATFLLLIPVSIGIAILRYRLWDIDPIISRALGYGALTVSVVAFYGAAVFGLGMVLRARSSPFVSLLATAFIAVLFQPLQILLRKGVNRLLYGERDDPYTVISHLSHRLEETMAQGAILPTVVETVAKSLKLPYVAIALGAPGVQNIAAQWGRPGAAPLHFALLYQGEAVGDLLLAPRSGETTLSPADRRLLDGLLSQVGVAVHAMRLTTELQAARERLVSAREEERRRVRRDLHDGLGPMLGSLAIKLDVADDLLERDPAAVHAILRGLKSQAQTAITDIRRLVYALRPPALDELGLSAALRESIALYEGGHDGVGVTIVIDVPDDPPPMAAAVEVAAYRIVQEALANVIRHAQARACTVRLTVDAEAGRLCLDIIDDGRGLPSMYRAGVGLNSMRERAEELGGRCNVETIASGGTRVSVSLPCRMPDGAGDVSRIPPATDSNSQET